jgi:hypothetical protein
VNAVAANPRKPWGMFPFSDVTAIPDRSVATAGGSGGHNRGKPNVMHACRVNGARRVHRSVYQAFCGPWLERWENAKNSAWDSSGPRVGPRSTERMGGAFASN